MIDHRRALRSLRATIALCCIVLLAAACNLGAPEAQTLPTQSGIITGTVPATRTLIPGVPTSRVVTTTPIPFPTRIAQVFPTAYVPPQTNPQPTALPLPYSIVILSPLPGNVIAGNVQVLGSASHPQFLQYRLEFGPDPNPNNLWFPITGVVQTPLVNGALGVWSTVAGGSPDGYYQIRLRVFLRDGSQQITTVNNVRVQNRNPTPVPTATQNVQAPIAAFTQDYTTGNAPLVVRFFNQSQGQITSYLWNFGTGNLSSALNPIETFTRPGTYNVTLTVSGPGGTANVTRQINVTSPSAPVAAFIPNKLSGALDPTKKTLEVTFNNRSTGNITTYDWDFGDGTTSKAVSPTHAFKAVGNYNVILKATGPGGSNTAVRQITVSNPQIPAPVADFKPGVLTETVPFTVQFDNLSSGQITGYLWDLDGDGFTNSTDAEPTFTYTKSGKYNVRLDAVGPGGRSTKTIQIDAKDPVNAPVANFTADPISGTTPLVVKFTNTTTGAATSYAWDFNGDGTPDTTDKDTSFTFVNPGTYPVRLIATGAAGSTQKDVNISVSAPIPAAPVAAFTALPTSGQSPLTVIFTNASTGQVDSFSWDFNGDGKGDNTVDGTVSFTYNTPGTYAAALTVSNPGGTDTEQVTITVNAPPGAPTTNFTVEPASGDAPLTVVFTNTSTGTVDSLAWDFNNDDVVDSTAAGPVEFTYTVPGSYVAKLTASNSGGAASATKTIEVETPLPAAPVASFTADPVEGTSPLTVTFTNTSEGAISSLSWDFNGDSEEDSTDNTASAVFEEPGTYTASLTVTNAGGSDTATVDITVGEPAVAAPVADFTASPTAGEGPLTVTFTNISSGTVDTLSWDFNGDGTEDSNSGNTGTFTFEEAGTYESALTVTNEGGTSTKNVTITVSEAVSQLPDAPVASFTADPTNGAAPLTVNFMSTSSGTVDSLSWDFNGDGTADNTTEASSSFTFSTEGTYTATLTVTNAGGSNTATQTITVGTALPAAPVASFTADPLTGSAPLTVTFANTTAGPVDTLSWDFNTDGTPDNTSAQTATFTYDAPGTYTATLTVTNAGGSNSATQTITVNTAVPDAPVAQFSTDTTSGNAPLTVTFQNNTTGTVDSVSWDFDGNGSADSASTGVVTFTYQTEGTYTARLTATNAGGSSSDEAIITVAAALPNAPVAAFTADPLSGPAPLTVNFANTTAGPVDSISWDFDGNGSGDSSDNTTTFTYPTEGTYTAILTVTNAGGSNSTQQVITVGAPVPAAPVASFTAAPASGPAPLTVTFSNASSGQVDSISWDFTTDGSADNTTDATTTFKYDVPGTYTATMTVTNAGGSNSSTQTIVVGEPVPAAPGASFTANPTSGNAPLTVNFVNTSTGPVDSISWDFDGNGSPDDTSSNTPSFTYQTDGIYSPSLTVTNAGGSNTISVQITVSAAAVPPTASFTADPTSGSAPLTVTFNSTSTNAVSLEWDFTTDGTPDDSNVSTSFTYGAEGSFVVTLKATGADGQTSTTSQTITVGAAAPTVPQGQIVYVVNNEIYVANTDGNGVQQLTTDNFNDQDVNISRNGQNVVFVSSREDGQDDLDIYTFSIDNPGNVIPLTSHEGADTDPAWSPDGSRIAFVSTRDGATKTDIWVMDANGQNQVLLTSGTENSNEFQPSWSPTGEYIVFVTDRDEGSGTDNEIYVMDANGANPKALTNNSDNERDPAWAPTGDKIAYTSNASGGNDNIWTMNANGEEQTQLTTDPANQSQPSWSSDAAAQYIIYISNQSGTNAVYIMNRDGTQQTFLSNGDAGQWVTP